MNGPLEAWVISDSIKIAWVSLLFVVALVFLSRGHAQKSQRLPLQALNAFACLTAIFYLLILHGLAWEMRGWRQAIILQAIVMSLVECEGNYIAFMAARLLSQLFDDTPEHPRLYITFSIITILTELGSSIVALTSNSLLVGRVIMDVGELALVTFIIYVVLTRMWKLLVLLRNIKRSGAEDAISEEIADRATKILTVTVISVLLLVVMTATFLFHIFSYLFELSVADRFSDYYEHNLAHYEAPKDLYVFSILLLMTINTLFCYESATVQPSNYNTAFLMSNPGPSSYIAMPGLAGAPTGIPPPISVRQPPHSHNHTLSSRAPIARTDAEL